MRPPSSATAEPVTVRPIMDQTDLLGWLFLKVQGNGERLRVQMLSHLGCVRPIVDPADLIGWPPKPAIIRMKMDPSDLIGMLPLLPIGEIVDTYKQMFGPANNMVLHLDKPHHLENGASDMLDVEGIGRVHIATAFMTM